MLHLGHQSREAENRLFRKNLRGAGVDRQRGFTLIELMVALAVLVILVTTAAPMFTTTVVNNRLASVRDNLISSFQYAKSEAITRNANVSICPSSNGTSCLASDDWTEGWIVYVDSGTGNSTTVSGTPIRRVEGQDNVDFTMSGSPAALTPSAFIRYVPQGFASYAAPIGAQTIGFCDPDGRVDGRSIIISATSGQVRPGTVAEAGC